MSLLSAYLSNPKTRKVLSKRPGEAGFSLIELVVVIAVLAVLTAIALPNFLGVSDDAAARSAQQAVINAAKECQASKARGKTAAAITFAQPSLNDFLIVGVNTGTSGTATGIAASQPAASTLQSAVSMSCFTSAGAIRDVMAFPKEANKFPTFVVTASGEKICATGTTAAGSKTYNIGCDSTSDSTRVVGWQ